MKKYIKILFTMPLLFLLLTGCKGYGVKGNGNLTEETRPIESFEDLEVSGAYNVSIYVGGEPSLEISGEENLLKYIAIDQVGSKLKIYNEKNIRPRKRIVIKISTPSLEYISSSGASNIYAEAIDSKDFDMDLSGAGSIELKGDVEKFKADLSGAGNLNARQLLAKYVSVNISGASNADVFASEKLKASVSGVGRVNFYGDPKDVQSDVSGIGTIKRRQ